MKTMCKTSISHLKLFNATNIITQYQEEEDDGESKKQSKFQQAVRRNLDALPQKAENLFSQNIDEVVDAATFFRKVLATGESKWPKAMHLSFNQPQFNNSRLYR